MKTASATARVSRTKPSVPDRAPAAARPKPGKHSRQPDEVRARILEAAITAFAREGYNGARMRNIASDAGISIQLLVHHVKSKEALWRMVMEHILGQYEQHHAKSKALPPTASAGERLKQAIADLVEFTAGVPELHRIMVQEGGQLTPRMIWLTENLTRKNFAEWCQLIEEAQRKGAVRPCSPALLRYAIVSMAAVPFVVSAEYQFLTGKDPHSRGEINKLIEMITGLIVTG